MLLEQNRQKDWLKLGLALSTFILSFIVYLLTMAPTVSFWDCGEFIACSATMAVPHPPGAPMFLLFGRIFSMIPFSQDIAYRINMMSVITSAAAILFLYLIVVLLLERFRTEEHTPESRFITYFSAFIGAMAFAFTDSHWFNAVETEVYALSTLLTAMTVWLILKWDRAELDEQHGEKYILFMFYILGIAVGIHLLNILAIPFIALVVYFRYSKFNIKSFIGVAALAGVLYLIIHKGIISGIPKLANLININPAAVSFPLALLLMVGVIMLFFYIFGRVFKDKPLLAKWTRMVCVGLILVTIGYSSYEVIFIRTIKNPRIDENNPQSVSEAVYYLEREQYGTHSWARDFALQQSQTNMQYKGGGDFFWRYQLKRMYTRYFNWQFMGRGEGGGVGWNGADTNPRQLFMLPFLFGMIGAFYHFRKDKNRAFSVLALFFMTGIAIVLYVNNPDPQPRERDYSYVGSFFTFAIWIGVGAYAFFDAVLKFFKKKQARQIVIASLSVILLIALPVNLLAANYKSHSRKGNYVASDYAHNLLNSCEEGAILFTNGDNDTFPLWYMQEVEKFRLDVRVVNLSLLNTPWYIKQIKNIEPKIKLPWTDKQIDRIRPIPWETQEVTVSGIKTTIKPTYTAGSYKYLRVQDLMIMELIRISNWERPIYFAATVSRSARLGMDDHLAMEGQVLRLYQDKVDAVDEDKIYENFTSNYRFRNLNNPDVYYGPNTQRLMQNYRTAVLQAAIDFMNNGENDKAKELLDTMSESIPEDLIPQYHPELSLQTGRLYYQLGDTAEYKERMDNILETEGLDQRTLILAAQELIFNLKDYRRAEAIVLPMYRESQRNNWVAGMLVKIYQETGEYTKALNIIDQWLKLAPNDTQAKQMKREIIELMEQ